MNVKEIDRGELRPETQDLTKESEQPVNRAITPNLLEPLSYEIIQLDDDEEEEEEVEEQEEQEVQDHVIEDQEENEEFIAEKEEPCNNSQIEAVKVVQLNKEQGKRKFIKTTNNLVVDISQSIKWHEIIQDNKTVKVEEITSKTKKLKK